VKNVAKKTLQILREEKLNIPNWRESREITNRIKTSNYGPAALAAAKNLF